LIAGCDHTSGDIKVKTSAPLSFREDYLLIQLEKIDSANTMVKVGGGGTQRINQSVLTWLRNF